jgi:GntR family transcriptional regulator / MocR family aminotransferase
MFGQLVDAFDLQCRGASSSSASAGTDEKRGRTYEYVAWMSPRPVDHTMEIILRLYDPGVRAANRQLYTLIRNLIVNGELSAGAPVPPSRTIADALGLSRTTVTSAVDSLSSEGYLTARQGAGTYVTALFAASRRVSSVHSEGRPSVPVAQQLSTRLNETISATQSPFDFVQNRWRPFTVGTPMASDFPYSSWRRALAEAARRRPRNAVQSNPSSR